jgi:NADH dehydrogenase
LKKQNVVIVGGGFGGVKLALDLVDDMRFHVTLITDRSDFRNYPTLYLTATGGKRMISSIPLDELFAGKAIDIVIDPVTSLDRKQKTVTTKSKQTFTYDALVLALGVVTNYFGIEGLEQYSYTIKSPEGAEALKKHLHQQLLDTHKPDLNYVVVGGGPTGVELAGALPSYLKAMVKNHGMGKRKIHVDLVEAAPRLLPRSSKDVSRRVRRHLRRIGVHLYLKTVVQAQTADALMVGGRPLKSHTVVWTAGVMNHPFFGEQGFQIAPNRKVRVDQFLQSDLGIYVIGDNADTPYSGMAQTALYDGIFVARNLKRIVSDQQPKPYVAKRPVYVFPAGDTWAAVHWGPLRIYGRPGFWLRSVADLVAYHDYEPWWRAGKRWAALSDREESCPYCS